MTAERAPDDRAASPSGPRRQHLLAAGLFLAAALWALRVMLPAPATTFAIPQTATPQWKSIFRADQKLTAANVTWNARRFSSRPWELYEPGQCFPTKDALALGPHQLGEGLLGVAPYLVTHDPIATYNAVAIAALWLPALTMYALVHHLTGSIGAAIVAGLAFALHPARVTDVMHLDVHGNHWAPLTLLFLHRLFTTGRYRDAAGLWLSLALQVLGSVYQLLGFVVLGGAYGIFVAAGAWRRLPGMLTPLAGVAVGTAIVAALVFAPYLHMREAWHVVSGRQTLLLNVSDFGIGGAAYPGSTLTVLALIAIAHRWRGRLRTSAPDMRIALLVATALLVWASVWEVRLPGGVSVPSLFTLAGRVLPGLDAIRAGGVIGFGVVLTGAVLAGYGAAALTARRRPATRVAITSVLVVACLVEVFAERVALWSFGRSAAMEAWVARPTTPLLELYRATDDAPILDVPYDFQLPRIAMADDLLLSAFHHRPVGACYNSFQLPLQEDIAALAFRLGVDEGAPAALRALGFGTVVRNELRRSRMRPIGMTAAGLQPLGRAAGHTAYRLESSVPVTTRTDVLEPGTAPSMVRATAPEARLAFVFRNGSSATFRHPDPIEPLQAVVRWRAGETVAREDAVRVLLPAALAAGDELTRNVTVAVPPDSGDYEVTLALPEAPERVLARAAVHVAAPLH